MSSGPIVDASGPLAMRLAGPPAPRASRSRRAGGGRALRVLHLLSQQPGKTGSGVYLEAMTRLAAERGLEQAVVCGMPDGAPPPVVPGVAPNQVGVVRFGGAEPSFLLPGMSDVMPYPSSRFSDLDAAQLETYLRSFGRVLSEAAATFAPDVIHSHHLWLLTALARHLLPAIPIVTSCHGTELRQLELASSLARYVVPGCAQVDHVLALHGDHVRRVVERYGITADRITVAGAGFRDDYFFPRPEPAGARIGPNRPTLIYAGKISRAKGLPWLLEALATLADASGSAPRLLVVGAGAGSEADAIVRAGEPLGDAVLWLGAKAQQELGDLFRRSDLFVLPSLYEGLPLVLLEAIACGCRAVVTELPGMNGWLPEPLRSLGLVAVVPLPRLVGPDEPHPDATGRFVAELAAAIDRQLTACAREPSPSAARIAELLRPFGWRGVFERVHPLYERLA